MIFDFAVPSVHSSAESWKKGDSEMAIDIAATRNAEINRLATQISTARGSGRKGELVSELLAFLGLIHNTPAAREKWENQ
jgi:hypothetical protein